MIKYVSCTSSFFFEPPKDSYQLEVSNNKNNCKCILEKSDSKECKFKLKCRKVNVDQTIANSGHTSFGASLCHVLHLSSLVLLTLSKVFLLLSVISAS